MLSPAFGIYIFLFIALYFEVFLLITFFEKRPRARAGRRALERYPAVTIAVPCFNEEATIERTIRSILALDYPADKLSVMVVDDGSTDETLAVARRFEHEDPKKPAVFVYSKRNGGKHTALNYAIRRTDAELIGCLDADSYADPAALREIVHAFNADPAVMAVTPAIKVFRARRFLEILQRAEYAFGIFQKRMFGNMNAIPVLPGPFSFYRRAVFTQIGLFRHAHQTEDMEMALRMHANRLKVENAHTAHVFTTVPSSLGKLVKQRVRWARGFLENSRDYKFMYFNPRFGSLGLFVLPAGVVAMVSALYLSGYFVISALGRVRDLAIEAQSVGVAETISAPDATWFFLNTSAMTILFGTLIALTIVVTALGKRLASEKIVSRDIFYFLMFYGFIAPLWLAKAVFNTALARNTSWR